MRFFTCIFLLAVSTSVYTSSLEKTEDEQENNINLYGLKRFAIVEDYSQSFLGKTSILCIACQHKEFVTNAEILQDNAGKNEDDDMDEESNRRNQYSRLLQLKETGVLNSLDDDFTMVNVDLKEGHCHITMDAFKLANWKQLTAAETRKFDKILVTLGYILPGMPIFKEMVKLLKKGGTIHHPHLLFKGFYSPLTREIIPSILSDWSGKIMIHGRKTKTNISLEDLKESRSLSDSVKPSYYWMKNATIEEIEAKKRDYAKFHQYDNPHFAFCQTEGYFLFLQNVKEDYFTRNTSGYMSELMEMNISFDDFDRILGSKYFTWLAQTFPQYKYSVYTTYPGIAAADVDVTLVESQSQSFTAKDFCALSIQVD